MHGSNDIVVFVYGLLQKHISREEVYTGYFLHDTLGKGSIHRLQSSAFALSPPLYIAIYKEFATLTPCQGGSVITTHCTRNA